MSDPAPTSPTDPPHPDPNPTNPAETTSSDHPDDDYPFTSPDAHTRHLTSTLSAYHLYRRTAHHNLTHLRRRSLFSLPLSQRTLLSSPPINLPQTLNTIDTLITANADLCDTILRHAIPAFDLPPELFSHPEFSKQASSADVEKVQSTIKQFYREWSAEGAAEREIAYNPAIEAIEKEFEGWDKGAVRVLTPGCGLGRLPFELTMRGYDAQGNENSFHQLLASNYVLNCSTRANEHTIYPWIGVWSNHRSRSDQLRGVSIPDVHPATALAASNASERFSMAAGDFVDAYNTEECKETFECVCTVFFVDTAWNFLDYVETIKNVLVDGGVWVNFGPLLWHWEGREPPQGEVKGVELTLEECIAVMEGYGLRVERRERGGKGEYVGSGERSMLEWVYEGELWVVRKGERP